MLNCTLQSLASLCCGSAADALATSMQRWKSLAETVESLNPSELNRRARKRRYMRNKRGPSKSHHPVIQSMVQEAGPKNCFICDAVLPMRKRYCCGARECVAVYRGILKGGSAQRIRILSITAGQARAAREL